MCTPGSSAPRRVARHSRDRQNPSTNAAPTKMPHSSSRRETSLEIAKAIGLWPLRAPSRPPRTATQPSPHTTSRATWDSGISLMEIANVRALYAELCELVHPAAASVLTMISDDEDGWRIDPNRQSETLTRLVRDNRGIMSDVLMACFNPPLWSLRVLHKFGTFRNIDALRKYTFKDNASWLQTNTFLRS